MKKKILYTLAAALLLFAGCEPKIDEFPASQGDADFTRYVALGNSLTAGYADGALYKSSQENSYPAILAKQFANAGGGNFTQPVVDNEDGLWPGKRVLGYSTDCKGVTSLAPVPATGTPTGLPGAILPVGYPVHNLGVPGAKTLHLLANNYGNPAGLLTVPPTANPYFVRMATEPATSVIADAVKLNPTFFTLWIGNNDVLGYALAGGENNGIGEVVTPAPLFAGGYELLINTLTANGAKGAIANIPDITSIPFFNTVPAMGLLLDEATATNLNNAYRQVELVVQGMGLAGFKYDIEFKAGYNAFVIEDRNFPYPQLPKALQVRQAKANELILLTIPQDSLKCAGMGSFSLKRMLPFGIPQNLVLDEEELQNIQNGIEAMNAKIADIAAQKGLAFVDVASVLKEAKTGIYYDGLNFNTKFVSGGLFSLDGVHMNAQGAAITANIFIKAINAKFNAKIPQAEITEYPGIMFP